MKCDREEPGIIECREFIGGLNSEKFKLRKVTEDVVALPSTPAYSERRPLMTAKVEDIRKMLRYIGGIILYFGRKSQNGIQSIKKVTTVNFNFFFC
jgi:hypothetical protein